MMQHGTEHILRVRQNERSFSEKIKQAQEHSSNKRAAPITLVKAPWDKEDDK